MFTTKPFWGHQHSWLMSLIVSCAACSGEVMDPEGAPNPTAKSGASGASTGVGAAPNVGGGVNAPNATSGAGNQVSGPGSGVAGATALPPVPPQGQRGGTAVVPTTELDPGRVVLRRLNRSEYDNTVRDLLGTTSKPARSGFAADDVEDGFDTIGNKLVMSLLLAEQLEKSAETLIAELLARPRGDAWRTRILACEPTAANAATCLPQILGGFMRNAYRRPVTDVEVQDRVQLATSIQQSSGDVMRGLNAALKSVLLSPHFIYRVELGDPASAAATPVTDYELASRLSYFLWASMPDETLFQAAEAKKLTPAGADLSSQVDRMLADPKSQGFIDSFAGQWLSARDANAFVAEPTKFPDFDDELRVSMAQETTLFFKALVAEKQPLTALVLANFTFVNDRLARHYGLPAGQSAFTKVSLDGSPRMGVLTQQTFLTVTSYAFRTSPVRRAEWVLEHLLCDPPPAAPPDVPALTDPVPNSAVTLRQQFELHRTNPSCASCHEIMDPIGFAFEHFDASGAYRTMDNGAPVNATGVLADGTPLSNAKDLAQAVATDADYAICLAKQVLTYAVGRSFRDAQAKAYAAGIGVPVKAGTWPDLLHAVVRSQAFLTRRGEAL